MKKAKFNEQVCSIIGKDNSGTETYYALLKDSGELVWARESDVDLIDNSQ